MMNRTLKITHKLHWFVLFCLLVTLSFCTLLEAKQKGFIYFDVKDVGEPTGKVHAIEPWKIIPLDPQYGGQWVVAGDVDGDGEVEIVSAENVNKNDVHYTSTAVAQKLDGSVLWRWGNPAIGRKNWHHDVACQIQDWDGDGKNEVVLCTKGYIVELDGASGREHRRIAIPNEATDCIVFCNLSGGNRPTDVLVKNRYHQIWAYNRTGKLLWTIKNPGGYRTAHQPRPIDLDGDGRDEIMAGYAMLNPDGSVRWVFKSKKSEQGRGHLDCLRVLRRGKRPEDFRLALTCCGANNVALIDGNGRVFWEISGHHFESIDVGQIILNHKAAQLLVDIDHQPHGKSPLWVLDEQGNRLGQIVTDYSRHHHLLDWTGDGINEILVAHNGGIYNHKCERIGVFVTPKLSKNGSPAEGSAFERSILTGDMTADGVPDVVLATPEAVYIFKNRKGLKPDRPVPLGTGPNFTLY
ncbi:MAG: hypothetical protein GWN81_06810 [Phycisphaerae bacterium]|nr:hypothetical protein [Phycisphaerae bacterium]NIV69651.1 hypothetical protein [Phycisphaerae bacterium]